MVSLKVTAEEKVDGNSVLTCGDDTLTSEEIALGYKQLVEVERAFRTLKSNLELRPVYHRKDERIRSRVTLCWLALLPVRLAEVETAPSGIVSDVLSTEPTWKNLSGKGGLGSA